MRASAAHIDKRLQNIQSSMTCSAKYSIEEATLVYPCCIRKKIIFEMYCLLTHTVFSYTTILRARLKFITGHFQIVSNARRTKTDLDATDAGALGVLDNIVHLYKISSLWYKPWYEKSVIQRPAASSKNFIHTYCHTIWLKFRRLI